jgi:type I site-specific restriction endonuclease
MTNGILYKSNGRTHKYIITVSLSSGMFLVGRCTCDNKDNKTIAYCEDKDNAELVMEALARYEERNSENNSG